VRSVESALPDFNHLSMAADAECNLRLSILSVTPDEAMVERADKKVQLYGLTSML
jgi:hypothetical protein